MNHWLSSDYLVGDQSVFEFIQLKKRFYMVCRLFMTCSCIFKLLQPLLDNAPLSLENKKHGFLSTFDAVNQWVLMYWEN